MESNGCQSCPVLDLTTWSKSGGETKHGLVTDPGSLLSLEFDVAVLFSSANHVRKCKKCRAEFVRTFAIPDLWWSDYCRNSNGFFGYEESNDKGGALSETRTWCRFLIKQLSETGYHWYKLNVFTTWDVATRRTVVLVLDLPRLTVGDLRRRLLDGLDGEGINDPFWMYARLVEEVVDRQDRAVWAVRDWVRATEKGRTSSERPTPDYIRLHDMARHAIHVSETLELGTNTVNAMLTHHRRITGLLDSKTSSKEARITNRLLFFHDILRSLHIRSASNRARLQNEIQLAFNAVAQYDARISVEIGRAAQADGAAMRTVAFVTLTFLPATFVCAIFSTSFFDYDAEKDVWSVSGQFWQYWAVAVPVTIVTAGVWVVLGRVFRPKPIGDGREGEPAGMRVGLRNMIQEMGGSESEESV